MLVAAHDTVVDHHQAGPAPEELLEVRALFTGDFHAVLCVDHEHVGVFELFRGREIDRTIRSGAALVEQFLPLGEEARVIVLVWAVGLDAGADKHTQRLVLLGKAGKQTRKKG